MDVVVVGSCNVDLISYVPVLPKVGETVNGTNFVMGCGGKGANQCVMASRLGAVTAMQAKVGGDLFGSNTIKNFKENNVNTDHVIEVPGLTTGVAPILVDEQGHNSIVVVLGANQLLTPDDVSKELVQSASVLLCQLEIPIETTLKALQLGKSNGVTTVLNAAPAVNIDISNLCPFVDILCINEVEAETFLQCPPLSDIPSAIEAVKSFYLKYPFSGTMVLTLGKSGVVYCTGSGDPILHVPATNVNVVDTTGAGDAFIGALGYYSACHKELLLAEKIRRAGMIASLSVTRKGTQSSYFFRQELPPELFSHA